MRISCFVVAFALASTGVVAAEEAVDWNARARQVVWKLEPKNTLDWALRIDKYDVELAHKAGEWADLDIVVKKAGKTAWKWKGTFETPMIVSGDTLFYVEHSPIASGASLVAVDLAKGKQLWKTELKGLGPQAHSKYRNRVAFETSKLDPIAVLGEESHGKYVELVDPRTGKTLATDLRK